MDCILVCRTLGCPRLPAYSADAVLTHALKTKFSCNIVKITGGTFYGNKADYGGFLYTDGEGTTSCKGASVEESNAVDGGGVYAVDGAMVDWECNLLSNSALSGPAM